MHKKNDLTTETPLNNQLVESRNYEKFRYFISAIERILI